MVNGGEEHFREVTRRICGSLDLDQALYEVFCYMRHLLPLDALFITLYEYEKRRSRVIALAYEGGGILLDEPFPLSDAAWESIRAWQAESRSDTTPWLRDHTHPINREILRTVRNGVAGVRQMEIGDFCSMTCGLRIQKTLIGNLTFGALGANHYQESHAALVREVNEPFAIALSNALRYMDLVRDHRALQRDARHMGANVMIGADSGLKDVRRLISHVAPTDSPVLLLGETGTGKEVVASEIHSLSRRSQGPFIRVNCGAIPESLIDSELFGHEKGAFTGAVETMPGRFERADGGTLFLDEIGELPPNAQVKLLRVLQSGEFERVGGARTLKASVRILAATHRNLESLMTSGDFRRDLWYRLNVFPLHIPPLRERRQDIPAMVHHFIRVKCEEMNLPYRPDIAEGGLEALMAYDWPGNVRELQNVVERALILCQGRPLAFPAFPGKSREGAMEKRRPGREDLSLDGVMTSHIRFVLGETGGRIAGKNGAAALLGLHPNTLRSRMKKLGML
ncbi:sigma-54 dependent transcriptional regulator [Desulfobotulus sp.]|jgi:transcriptional regulator with GAF, ATPase, and Fis domain|uniref:sigma-54 interaction domain-containing protein n=1 Tax=Desulfobotulus sp. TaxID=1940337 RepID=UPI002A3686D7|nr:sigma-54 dependent transcriptional regulator [Desulfobotulus sp.]MDY0163537.1 sigma-54 dependent transcriptional regulator [Desulfobotulus sp.]